MFRLLATAFLIASAAPGAGASRIRPVIASKVAPRARPDTSLIDLAARADVALPPALHQVLSGVAVPPALMQIFSSGDAELQSSIRGALEASAARMEACGEACQSQDPLTALTAEVAIKAAIEAAKLTIGVVSEVTKYIMGQVQGAREEITKWAEKITELAEVNIEEYTVKVARATVLVNQCDARAKALYASLLDVAELIVADLTDIFAKGDDDAIREALVNAQEAMSIGLEGATEELDQLIPQAAKAQTEFAEIGALSALYEQKIIDNMHNKDGWLDARKSHLRAVVYGGCAAGILLPPALVACYAIAAPILETKLKELDEDLASTRAAMESIAKQFGFLKDSSKQMEQAAKTSHDDMVEVNSRLGKTKRLVKSSLQPTWWQRYVLPDLQKLTEMLREKLGRK